MVILIAGSIGMESLMEKESIFGAMETIIKENLKMDWEMDMEYGKVRVKME